MKVIKPSARIIDEFSNGGIEELKKIERIGRCCYHSEDKITADGESAKKFVSQLITRGHESVLEHVSATVEFICDRGISHEIVRHRLASYTQESTRYCNYADFERFPDGCVFIEPCFFPEKDDLNVYKTWHTACWDSEFEYLQLIKLGRTPQEARTVLPNSLATKLYVTANFREWRHILKLRCGAGANPQIKEIMLPLAAEFKSKIPIIFDDVV